MTATLLRYLINFFSKPLNFSWFAIQCSLFLSFFIVEPLHAQNFRWVSKGTGNADDIAKEVTFDNAGNYYSIGTFSNTINFDSAAFTRSLTSAGGIDIYLAKHNCNRNLVWANRIGGTSSDAGNFTFLAIAYDKIGNLYITGAFAGSATFTTRSGASQVLSSSGDHDIFIAKYDTLGVLNWAVKAGGSGPDEGTNIVVDNSGNIILCGNFSNTATWEATSGPTLSLTSGGTTDIFVAKYDPLGKPIWVQKASSGAEDIGVGLAVDKQNNIYTTGNISCCGGGTATFGSYSLANAGSWGAFIAKLNSAGTWRWVNGMGGTSQEGASACIVDDSGSVFVSGHFEGSAPLSSSSPGLSIPLSSVGDLDIFLAKYDTSGVLYWAKAMGGTGFDTNRGLYLNQRNNLVITGGFYNTASFSGINLTSSGGADIYISEFTKAGTVVQCLKAGGSGYDEGLGVITDSKGSLFVTGAYTSISNFGTISMTGLGSSEAFIAKISLGPSFSLIQNPVPVCNGDSALLSSQVPLPLNTTFKWLKNGAVMPGETNDSIYVKTNGSYQLVLTNNCNESDTSLAIVVNFTTPSVPSPISDKTICLGDSVQLLSSGGSAYSWSPTAGLSDPNIAGPYAKPTVSQQYIVTITIGSCTTRDTVLVNVNTNCCFSCISPEPVNNGLIFCAGLNGNANDATPLPVTPTLTGSVVLTTDKLNTSNQAYDFTNSPTTRISYNASSKLNVPINQSFTMSAWFYQRSTTVDQSVITSLIGSDGKAYILFVGGSSWGALDRKIVFRDYDGPSLNKVLISSASNIQLNTWYHVAITIDKITGINTLYLNGVQVATTTIANNSIISTPQFYIGNNSVNAWGMNGKIDEVRIYNRALSPSEIGQLAVQVSPVTVTPIQDKTICLGDSTQLTASGGISYSWSPATGLSNPNIANPYAKPVSDQQYIVTISSGLCSVTDTVMVYVNTNCCFSCNSPIAPSINSGLVACLPFNGNANDGSGNGNNGTVQAGATITTDRNNVTSSAYSFNGNSNARINIPASASLNTGTMAGFTYACWFNASSSPTFIRRIFSIQDASFKNYDLSFDNGNNKLNFINFNGVSDNINFYSKTTFSLNTWYHVALVIDASNKANLYVNGVLDTFSTINVLKPSNPTYTIGNHTVNSWNFVGKIDDIRVYNRSLPASELMQLFLQKDLITITPIPDKAVCLGDSTQLTATGGLFYSWSPSAGLSNPNIANPYAKPISNQQYIVTISNGICSSTDTVMVYVSNNCCATCTEPLSINSGLIACYPFTANTNDVTGNGHHGTATGGVNLISDRFGNVNSAYTLNGSSGAITIPYHADFNFLPAGQFTISLWARPGLASQMGGLFVKSPFNANVFLSMWDYGLYQLANKAMAGYANNSVVQSNTTIVANTWYHLVVTYDNGKWDCYVNGSLETSDHSQTKFISQSAAGISIGKKGEANGDFYNGAVDDIRIYNRAISATEVGELFVLKPVLIPVMSPKSMCKGDSVQLSASGGTGYLWNPVTGLSNVNIANPYAKPADTTKYYVTVSRGTCSAIDSVIVNVKTTTVSAGSTQTICFRDSIQLQAAALPGSTFTWTPSASLSNATIYNPYAKPADTTKYRVVATLNGCSATDSVIVNVKKVAADAGSDAGICIGDSVRLNATGGTAYAWQQDITLSDTAVSNPYAKPIVTSKYFVYVTNNGCTNIDSVIINITSSIIVNAGIDTSLCLGDSVRLLATGATSYAWWTAPTLSDTTVANPYAKPSDTTTYYVTGKSSACFGTDSVKVNVKKPVVDAGTNQTICKGDSIQLNATGSPGSTFSWTPTNSLINPAIANPYAKPTDTTMYTVVGTSNSCNAADSVKISVRKVNADAGPAGSVCLGDSIQLSAGGGTSYTWKNDPSLSTLSGATPYAKPDAPTTYYVTVGDGTCNAIDSVSITLKNVFTLNAGIDTAVCLNDTVQLQASGATSFTWTPATGLNSTIVSNPKANPVITTDYIVTGLAGVCYETDTVKVTVRPLPTVDLGADTTICQEDAITFLPLVSGANQYSWQPVSMLDDGSILNPTAVLDNGSQLFTLTATNTITGCVNSDDILVTTQKPTAQFTLDDTTGAAPFVVTPNNTSYPLPLSYEWEMLDTIPAYYTTAEPTHTFGSAGQFLIFLAVTDSRGCYDTISRMVTVSNEARLFIPNVFTPTGDGLNDLFEVSFPPGSILGMTGTIWNRWGSKVYEFSSPDYKWWDGKVDGQFASVGVYFYIIKVIDLQNEVKEFHGTVTLLR